MTNIELHSKRYQLLDKFLDWNYNLATSKNPSFLKRITINLILRFYAFKIHQIDKKIHI